MDVNRLVDRDFLIALRSQAREERDIVVNENWKNALTSFMVAVDHLDAMVARSTVNTLESSDIQHGEEPVKKEV